MKKLGQLALVIVGLALLAIYQQQAPQNASMGSSSVSGKTAGSSKQNIRPYSSRKSLPDYETARSVFWKKLYSGKVDSLYCRESFQSSQRRGYNVEHVFPMSWVTSSIKCGKRKQCRTNSPEFNQVEADLHNLYPARADVNQERSSFAFGMVGGEKREFGRCDFEVDYRARFAEPAEQVRGEVARAMFYMAYQYRDLGLKLFDKQSALLLRWHEQDPPSAEELRRNGVIERIQGNRNPFIDDPQRLSQMVKQGYFRQR